MLWAVHLDLENTSMFARQTSILTLVIAAVTGDVAFGQGVGGVTPIETSHLLKPTGGSIPEHMVHWYASVGAVDSPITVELDPIGPAWVQHYQTQDGDPIDTNRAVEISENLIVGGDIPWTGWHVELANPDFIWLDSLLSGPFTLVVNGSGIPVALQRSPSSLDVTFPSLSPGTAVEIIYYFGRASAEPPSNSFDIRQFPVPEPTSLAGAAIAGAFCIRRRSPNTVFTRF